MAPKDSVIINSFDGAIGVFNGGPPHPSFDFQVVFLINHPHLKPPAAQEKLPLHFHPYQKEYIEVTEGVLGVEVEGQEYELKPGDGDFTIRPIGTGTRTSVSSRGKRMSIFEIINMFDAGGSYLSFPSWIPFGRWMAQIAGIVVGRWLGGSLGYQPFHRRWTGDWDLASRKMGFTGLATELSFTFGPLRVAPTTL
ncbi:hypothetical protein F5Y12DRAFT_785288 [Xylaria sp. FL1777]|nr:hypothetical protein F5Y12DRAFT_785288 [Xylaria sp. FL1777]